MDLKIIPYTSQKSKSDTHLVLKLTKADFENIPFQDGKSTLSFFNCLYEKVTIINEEEIPFQHISIAFFNCLLPEIEVEVIKSENISIGFYGSFISGEINTSKLQSVDINNCITSTSLFLIDIPKVQINFTKENFRPDLWQGLFIQHYIENSQILLENPIKFYIYNPQTINLSSNFVPEEEFFYPEIVISYKDGEHHTETIFKGLSLNVLSITGNPAGNVSLENSKVRSWYISDFIPTGTVSIYSIEPISLSDPDNRIGIHNSKLDGVEFDNVSFNKYPIISFYRTKFSKAIFTSCDFPDDYNTFSSFVPIENVHYPNSRPSNYAKAQYEIFLQLKKALEDRGNYYEAQKLQAISHEALRQIKTISRYDRAILNINNLSNNHGLSIKRPLLGFLIISIPLYIIYLLSVGRVFNSSDFDLSLIGYYFSFIDITHRADFLVDKNEFSWWTLIIDYIGKISVGFFIYQFIAAFRKYGKR
ncbi:MULTISPECIES: hypothetical protein [Sphingobacterium]|uniref:hypothetical protein n=1 Tax=Sphingobacterium TaxID=28453 RepID=UPI0008A3AF91|nr:MULTISPECIES: hypothetical protein [Sphingobacterium]OFV12851.1 hypothetical protein HMPREF3127_15875 [Sphingobacterium sp. HMSC13C05]OJZ09526.1 MAG: hypothetical protein BGP15_26395 [Sphingobacterium sp. 40-24]